MYKSKTRQEIANEYGVNRKTFYKMLKRADLNIPSGLITPASQKTIYDHFGHPYERVEQN